MSKVVFVKDKGLFDVTLVDNIFITEYMPDAPELAVKAYLYGLMLMACPHCNDSDIAAALAVSDSELRAAYAYWESRGVLRVVADEPMQVQYFNLKEYSPVGVTRSLPSDARYSAFIGSLQTVLGTRMLSGAELSKIYDWLDVFGFEQSAAIEIVRHCLDTKGARVSVSYMDAVARTLSGAGALTRDAVMEHFEAEKLLRGGAAAILKRLNKRRMPTEDELALYEKWTSGWGFEASSIELACAEMTAAGNPSFKYLDSVLDTWRQGGAINADAIAKMQKDDDRIYEVARDAFARAGIKRKPSAEDRLCVREWIVDWRISAELIFLAAELAVGMRQQFSAMKGIVSEWHDKGISSVSAARAYYDAHMKNNEGFAHKQSKASYKRGNSYSKDDLKQMGISFGEEFYKDDDKD